MSETERRFEGGPRRARLRALALSALVTAMLGAGADSAMADYTAQVQSGTLKVSGDGDADQLALRLAPGAPGTLQVDVGADGTAEFSFDRSTFTAIEVNAGSGDDRVVIDQTGGGFTDEAVTLNGNGGADTLIGGAGADVFNGGGGDDVVDGNTGQDRALLGDGNDRFNWDPGDSSDTVEGQGGDDRLDFNGANIGEKFDVSRNGKRVRLTRDIGNVTMDLDTLERVSLRTLGGADSVVTGELAGTATKSVDVDLRGFDGNGDTLADTVTARGTDNADSLKIGGSGGAVAVSGTGAETRVSGGEAIDAVNVAAAGGADTVTANVGIPGVAEVNIDGGDGADTEKYVGTADADQIAVIANGTEVRTDAPATAPVDASAVEDLVLQGLDGADTITSVGNVASLTKLTYDGGSGGDTLLGGNGGDILLGGPGEDFVDGNQGSDRALLGDGNDRAQWDPGDSNDTVEGQGGEDALDFNGSNIGENIEVSANGTRVRLTRDIAGIVTDLATLEKLTVHARGGTDTVSVNELAGTAAKSVNVDLEQFGGGGDAVADTVIDRGTDNADSVKVGGSGGAVAVSGSSGAETRVSGGEAIDAVNVAALGGADAIAVGVGIPGPAEVNVDGGDGADKTTYAGTGDADQIGVIANGTEVRTDAAATAPVDTTAVEDLVVQGLAGGDTISAVGNLAPLTRLTYDGGADADTLLGSNGADLLLGGGGEDLVDGNQGQDRALLGDGNDRFQWDPGDSSDTVEGQAGEDQLDFNGSNIGENIDVTPNGKRVRLTRNIATVTTDLDTIERLQVRALGGADTIATSDLAGTALKAVDVDLRGFDGNGDTVPDTVITRGSDRADTVDVSRADPWVVASGLAAQTRILGSERDLDTLRVETLGGDDQVNVAPGVSEVIVPIADLGADG